MVLPQYIVDAFTSKPFAGNPAAVCILEEPLSDDTMLSIAKENNLSETAFLLEQDGAFNLRWFTPAKEVDLCGHATLATGHTVLTHINSEKSEVVFDTLSGKLIVRKECGIYRIEFPAYKLNQVSVSDAMSKACGSVPKEAWMSRDLVCVFDDESVVRNMKPDQDAIAELDGLILHVTAPGAEYDCVSRSFAPKLAIPEDPVCGSGHCHIFPYWAQTLEKAKLVGFQASARGGVVHGEVSEDKVVLGGEAVTFSEGRITF